jgi:hypothetical protein
LSTRCSARTLLAVDEIDAAGKGPHAIENRTAFDVLGCEATCRTDERIRQRVDALRTRRWAEFAITHCFEGGPLPDQKIIVTPMTITANVITAVAIQPIHRRPSWMGNFPMILGLPVMCIMVIMIGTATTPLITALQ